MSAARRSASAQVGDEYVTKVGEEFRGVTFVLDRKLTRKLDRMSPGSSSAPGGGGVATTPVGSPGDEEHELPEGEHGKKPKHAP